MPDVTRTFVAIELPPEAQAVLTAWQHDLRPHVPSNLRWSPATQMHLTLAFLGEVRDADLPALLQAVSDAAAACPTFELFLQGLGAFPSPARPRVLWAGVAADPSEHLATLHQAVTRAVAEAGYPAADDGRFHPHVTLARFPDTHRRGPRPPRPPDLTTLVEARQAARAGPYPVAAVTTLASELRPAGPVYTPLAIAPLAVPPRA